MPAFPVLEGQSLWPGAKAKTSTKVVVASLEVEVFIGNYAVSRVTDSHAKGTPYQRPLQKARVRKFANALEAKRVDVPTAVTANIRDFDPAWLKASEGDQCARLVLPDNFLLWIVDGQHRMAALEQLHQKDPERWRSFKLQVVIMLGAIPLEEMHQFYVVNSTAKSVSVGLALDLLKQQADHDPRFREGLQESGELWKTQGQELAQALATDCPTWEGRIRFPSMEHVGTTTITSASFVSSVKRALAQPYFGQLSPAQQSQVMSAYWTAIERALPNTFSDPKAYAIQKGLGAMVLNGIFPEVLAVLQSRHQSPLDPDAFQDIIETSLKELQGDNGEGNTVVGEEFWRVAPDGAAGAFSSSAGRRVLTARLLHDLPPVEVGAL